MTNDRRTAGSLLDDEVWLTLRQACLMVVDAIERMRGMSPRTAELRRERRNAEVTAWGEP